MIKYGIIFKFFQILAYLRSKKKVSYFTGYEDIEFPKRIDLGFTNICNHKCIMCPNSNMKREKGYLSKELLDRILK